MPPVSIATIVEGHGECDAVPVLIRRIARDVDPGFVPQIIPPHRIPVAKLKRPNELERAILLACQKTGRQGGIVIIVDCDDGCPATEGPALLARAKGVCPVPGLPICVILAKKEFEAWFLAAAESLSGCRGLPTPLIHPEAPEQIRNAKGWLSDQMPRGSAYSETGDQAALTFQFDMSAARERSDSFDKCYRDVYAMLSSLRTHSDAAIH